jgi:hypothetical protein
MTIILSRLALVIALLLAIVSVPFAPAFGQNTTCAPNPNQEVGGGILLDENGLAVTNDNGEAVACDPATGQAYQFSRSGIFGCNQNAAYRMSVGALSARGGVYVPVNDAAVTLNTGYLVYKECVLDGVSKRFAENASTGLVNKGLIDATTGRDGGPRWPADYIADVLARSDQTFVHLLESGALSTLDPTFQGDVVRAVARNYRAQTRVANQALACPYQGDLNAVLKGKTNDVFGGLMALTNPACNPLGAYNLAQDYANREIALQKEEMLFRLTTGQGFYGVEECDPVTGRYITKTPGSLVASNIAQLVQSGFRQLENVTEIDQMVGALFSSLSTQVISDSQGLTGLIQSVAGQPSYLEQMTREAAQGLRESAINAALQILSAARQIEAAYYNSMNAIGLSLTQTIGQLRQAEKSCWELVIPEAQNYASQHNFQIQVATSTAFSQQIIDSQIAPLASTTIANIQKSERALSLIEQLIAGVTNTTSLEAQRIALQQLDSLVARGELHTQYDAQQAGQRRGEVEAAMADLVEDTVTAWGDSTDLNVGWCNINSPDVAQMWAEQWRR